MLIAHLPAGYLGGCAIERWAPPSLSERTRRMAFWAFLIGSMLPDIDMLYFHLVDLGLFNHHTYWTHLPVFWLGVELAGLWVFGLLRWKAGLIVLTSLVAGVVGHLLLDTPFGGVAWLAPFSRKLFYLAIIPAKNQWWVWNFIFHWSFLCELAICLAGVVVFWKRRKPAQPLPQNGTYPKPEPPA